MGVNEESAAEILSEAKDLKFKTLQSIVRAEQGKKFSLSESHVALVWAHWNTPGSGWRISTIN